MHKHLDIHLWSTYTDKTIEALVPSYMHLPKATETCTQWTSSLDSSILSSCDNDDNDDDDNEDESAGQSVIC